MALLVIVAAALRTAVFLRPLPVLDRVFIPDDTYYTLSIARSIAHGHGPTTDGHTLTSGFQPLIAFLMVPVYWVTDNPDHAVRADMAFLLLVDVAIVVLLAFLGRRLVGPVAGIVAAAIWAASPAAVRLAAGGLETTLAIACQLGLVLAWFYARDRPPAGREGMARWALVGVLGACTVLARVDGVGIVVLLAAVQVWKGPRRPLLTAGGALAVTLLPWWGYCIAHFGNPIPMSGTAARALQGGGPFNHTVSAAVAGSVLGGPIAVFSDFPRWALSTKSTWPYWLCVGVVAAIGLAMVVAARRGKRSVEAATLGALALFAFSLLLFYGWLKIPYYAYRYVWPVAAVQAIYLGALAEVVTRWVRARPQLPVRIAGWSVVTLMGAALFFPAPDGFDRLLHWKSRAPASSYYLEAATGYRQQARWLNTIVPDHQVIGAHQSGALGYYAEGDRTVINLDGVVNAEAARALRDNGEVAFLRRNHIGWIADWGLTVAAYDILFKHANPPGQVVVVAKLQPPGNGPFWVGRIER